MNSSRPKDTADFSRAGYEGIVDRARALGYACVSFDRFPAVRTMPVLLLRHDLDHSLRAALPLAELEAGRGIRATYFVQVGCDFYNLLGREGRQTVARLAGLGHEVGLHYDGRRYAAARAAGGAAAAVARLRLDVELLEDIAGVPIVSASQHLPCDTDTFDVHAHVENEAYEARFTAGSMAYVSDSLRAWRQATPHDLLDRRADFQFLSHPIQWARPEPSLHAVLARAQEEECGALRAEYAAVEAYYDDLLARREELDERFRARRDELDAGFQARHGL